MQTRKRAKSITFGKPKTVDSEEKNVVTEDVAEKEEVKATAEEQSETPEKVSEEKAAEKEEPQEPTEAAKKVMDSELSPTLTAKEEDSKEPELSSSPTSSSDDSFVTDTSPSKETTDESKTDEKKSDSASELSATPEPTLSTPIIEETPETGTETSSAQPSEDGLSATPPPSAFSLQEGGDGTGDSGGKKKNLFVYFLVIALFSFILGIGAMALLTSGLLPVSLPKEIPFVSQVQNAVKPSSMPAPTSAPQPTTVPTEKPVDLKAFKISVLNGSGIRGKAADVKTTLESAGFTVSTTGNADRSTYTKTQISAKKEVSEEYLEKLKTELGKELVVEVAAAPAPASQATDIVVTLGKDTAQ